MCSDLDAAVDAAVAEYAECGVELDADAVREALFDASGEPLAPEAAAARVAELAESLEA